MGDWARAVRGYRAAAERDREDLHADALARAEAELQASSGGGR